MRLTAGESVASGTSRDVLGRGLRVLGRAIREQPRIFAVAVSGSVLFGLLVIASAYVVGGVVGKVVVPAVERGEVARGALALAATALLGISVLRVVGIFGRRLGAGYMQYRLQAAYRRRVTRRYLELPLAWHHRNSTGTLLSNANSDVEAAWYPIAPHAVRGRHAGDAGRRGGLAVRHRLGAGPGRPGRVPRAVRAQRGLLPPDGAPAGPGAAAARRGQRHRARELRRRAGGQDDGPRGRRRPPASPPAPASCGTR